MGKNKDYTDRKKAVMHSKENIDEKMYLYGNSDENNDDLTFGGRLKKAREYRKISQEKLGALIGKTKANIISYEKHGKEPGVFTVIKIIEELKTNPYDLLGLEKPFDSVGFNWAIRILESEKAKILGTIKYSEDMLTVDEDKYSKEIAYYNSILPGIEYAIKELKRDRLNSHDEYYDNDSNIKHSDNDDYDFNDENDEGHD